MAITPQTLREIMLTAWEFRRDEPARTFADCLRGAWKFVRGMKTATAKLMRRARRSGGRVAFSASLIRSPVQRATATQRHAGRADWHGGYTTAKLGR